MPLPPKRFFFALAALVCSTVLVGLGHLTGGQWVAFVGVVGSTYILGQTSTDRAEHGDT